MHAPGQHAAAGGWCSRLCTVQLSGTHVMVSQQLECNAGVCDPPHCKRVCKTSVSEPRGWVQDPHRNCVIKTHMGWVSLFNPASVNTTNVCPCLLNKMRNSNVCAMAWPSSGPKSCRDQHYCGADDVLLKFETYYSNLIFLSKQFVAEQ